MPTCAPAVANAISFAEPTTTHASVTSSPRRSVSSLRVVRADRADAIALHAAERGSGRVGRSAAGRALDADAVRLAVAASVRHVDTDYDVLLMSDVDRESARAQVHARVEDILGAWRDGAAMLDD